MKAVRWHSLQQSDVLIHIILQTQSLDRAFQVGILQCLKVIIDRSYFLRALILIETSNMTILFCDVGIQINMKLIHLKI